ncbi:MAG: hypothetical protein AB1597_02260 [Chloroflexota bacterium]
MKRLTKIVGILAALSLLVGLIPMASAQPAEAVIGTLGFGTVTRPTSQTGMQASNSEVTSFGQSSDGTILWTDSSIAAGSLRRGGSALNWVTITAYLTGAGAAGPFSFVAGAPDDPDFFAVVTNGRTAIYVTMDKGQTWSTTSFAPPLAAGEFITGIDVSAKYPVAGGDARDIAVCTGLAAAAGRIFILQLKPFGVTSWIQSTGAPAYSWRAIKFAPAYAGDFSILAVGATAADTFLALGVRDINSVVPAAVINWAAFTGYPVVVGTAGATATWAQLITADIAMPSDFQGQVDRMRRAYVCYDTAAAAGTTPDVYRVDNIRAYRLNVPDTRPYAMAYSGTFNAGKLLVGTVSLTNTTATVPVWRSLNPQSSAAMWDLPYKSPTGGFNIGANESRARPIWTPDGKMAFVGTMSSSAMANAAAYVVANPFAVRVANDESGWSVTNDDSDTWNGRSGLDTVVRNYYDLAASDDGKTKYLSSVNDYIVIGATIYNMGSIWRSVNPAIGSTTWERVLVTNFGTTAAPILRSPPDKNDGSIIFWGTGAGGTIIQRSVDKGQTWANTLPGFAIQDFALGDQNSIYALGATGVVRKGTSTGPGWLWSATVDPRIGSGNRIVANGDNVVIGPGTAGMTFVAYSTNGGASYPRIMYTAADFAGSLRVPGMDPDFANNKTLFMTTATSGTVGGVAAMPTLAAGDTINSPVALPAVAAATAVYIPIPGFTAFDATTGQTYIAAGGLTITLPATFAGVAANTTLAVAAVASGVGATFANWFTNNGAGAAVVAPTGNVWRWAIGKNTNTWDTVGAPAAARNGVAFAKSGEFYDSRVNIGGGVDRSLDALNGHPKPGVNWSNLTIGMPADTFGTPAGGFAVTGKSPEVVVWVIGGDAQLYGFIDKLTDISPAIQSPKPAAGATSVTLPVAFNGFASPFGIHWNLPAPETQEYNVQISASSDFSDIVTQAPVNGVVGYVPALPGDPSWFIANPAGVGIMGGNTYYARVRVVRVDNGQAILTDWSKPLTMVVQSGVPVQAPYSAPQPQTPAMGAQLTMPASVGFTWTPMPGATEYKFVLATDANLTKTLVSTNTTSTSYSYDTALKEGVYFWQVTQTKPVASAASPVASFTVVAKPAPTPTPVVNVPAPVVTVQPPPAADTPAWVWVVIAIGAILVVVTIVLIFRTRKV